MTNMFDFENYISFVIVFYSIWACPKHKDLAYTTRTLSEKEYTSFLVRPQLHALSLFRFRHILQNQERLFHGYYLLASI